MRFYDPAHGRVLLDGIDISTINLHDLRTAISLVMQEPNIFNFNVMENILYGKLDATNTQILAAAQLSNCVEFIEKKELQRAEGATDVETAQMLRVQFESHKDELIALIGQSKYAEEIQALTKMEEDE